VRATIKIDDDVLAAARAIAEQQNTSIGRVISDLARRSLGLSVRTERNGIPVIARRSERPVTLQIVNKLRDELP
jgi:hypothetical protein